jgi:DNA-binding NtrC family response regulator
MAATVKPRSPIKTLAEVEREHVADVLIRFPKVTVAARALGISSACLYEKLRAWGVPRRPYARRERHAGVGV